MEKKRLKECGVCAYKYSCGYSALRRGMQTDDCCEPHLFHRVKKNFWSPLYQRWETAKEIEIEKGTSLSIIQK